MLDRERIPSAQEMTTLIHSTLQETVNALCRELDGMKAVTDFSYTAESVEEVVDRTRQMVVFLKYSADYLRRALPEDPVREEMLKIKLHLLSVLRSLSEAVRAQDKVAAHDLLTEELRDNLTLWKINILPMLRRPLPSPFGSRQS